MWGEKWPDDQRGGYSHPNFFKKIKKLGAMWKEVLDTIGQIAKI